MKSNEDTTKKKLNQRENIPKKVPGRPQAVPLLREVLSTCKKNHDKKIETINKFIPCTIFPKIKKAEVTEGFLDHPSLACLEEKPKNRSILNERKIYFIQLYFYVTECVTLPIHALH